MLVRDGYYYIKSGENKMKVALSFEDVMEQMPTSDLTATTAQVEPLCAIESLTKAANSDGTVSYTINYATSSFNGLIDSIPLPPCPPAPTRLPPWRSTRWIWKCSSAATVFPPWKCCWI